MRAAFAGLGLAVLTAFPVAAQDSAVAPAAWTRVRYLTTTTAYLEAGRDEGLREESVADVVRRGTIVARVRVRFLSSHSASGEIEVVTGDPAVGDSVRFVPVRPLAAGDTAPGPRRPAARSVRARAGRLHGRIGLRYLAVSDHSGLGSGLAQPALDAAVDGTALGGTPLGVSMDVRARRTTSRHADGTTGSEGRYRVYRLALLWSAAGSPVRVTLGRQHSAALAPVGFFDGLGAEYLGRRLSAGVFGGLQPDPASFGFSADVREGGGYLQLHAGPGGGPRWRITGGAVGSYHRGEIDREFAYLQASYSDRRVSLYGVQELDWNRGWKRDAGEPALGATSTFAHASVQLGGAVRVRGGFDTRRNVRLYRDVDTPETEFDDAYRQGWWGGVALDAGRLRLGADVRASRGGSAGAADAWTLSLATDPLTAAALGARLRATRYVTDRGDGWLHTASVGVTPFGALRAEISGGLRTRHDPLDDPSDSETRWVGADLDVTLARAWYLLLSATRESGSEASSQVYGGISWRF